jgi:glutamate synthase (NADPH/NADH) small chain
MTMDPKQIQEMEELCVQGHSAACAAGCPLHVDAKGMVEAVAKGDFSKGFEIFSEKVAFAGILGSICSHPCESYCKRKDVEEAINIGAIERACVRYGYRAPSKVKRYPLKPQKVAVVGGGLSGMTAAFYLAKKGYSVTIYERNVKIGGNLLKLTKGVLAPEVLQGDIHLLTLASVEIVTDIHVSREFIFEKLLKDYDAVYLGMGKLSNSELLEGINLSTMQTSNERVFAGGGMVFGEKNTPLGSVSSGQRAASSIERIFKGGALNTESNLQESYETKLYVNIEGEERKNAVPLSENGEYTREAAVKEAKRCLLCKCLECMKGCKYLQAFDQYPGKCIRSIVKNLIILPGFGIRLATPLINSCSLCGLCKEACPADIDMSFINRESRRIMWEKEYMPPALHYFPIRDMRFANSEEFFLAKNQKETKKSKYLFFPGCQLSASLPKAVKKTYLHLCGYLQGGVGLMLGCCGAPSVWAGRQELSQEAWDKILKEWKKMGEPRIIVACPSCYKVFKENMPNFKISFLAEVLNKLPVPEVDRDELVRAYSFHDPCTTRYEKKLQDSARELSLILGCDLKELPYNRDLSKCCSFGGLQYHLAPEIAKEVIADRANESPLPYLTSCSNCRDMFESGGKESLHILELYWGEKENRNEAAAQFDFSRRRDVRRKLKEDLLNGIWQEEETILEDYHSILLEIGREQKKKMLNENILEDDIKRVIYNSEQTGQNLIKPDGHIIAGLQFEIITYWVEYEKASDRYIIHNCYSHRMKLVTNGE